MSDIKLNLINHSNDSNNSEIVIFQKNVATDIDELSVAWTVIKNLAQGWHHPFTYPATMGAAASDSWGNELSQPLEAQYGQLFHVFRGPSGDEMAYKSEGSSPKDVEILNDLTEGSINARIYKDGKLLATKTGISPGEKASFQFKPTIWVGVASQVEEGEELNSAIISQINTEISLLGIGSADIVMTGGGTGAEATPFQFELQNVVYAG